MYSMALETGIFLSQAIWLWRVRHVRKEAKKDGKTYDEYVAENPSKGLSRSAPDAALAAMEAGHTASRDTLVITEKPTLMSQPTDAGCNASRTTLVSTKTQDHIARKAAASADDEVRMPIIACPEKAAFL